MSLSRSSCTANPNCIGILGGAMAFGFIGIFLGPTVLAILYTLMREWSPGDYVLRPATGSRRASGA